MSLGVLELNDNHFTGTLSFVQAQPYYPLRVLYLRNSFFSGKIPRWLQSADLLWSLDMSNNFFEAQIPCFLSGYYLIDLSRNQLSGSLASCPDLFTHVEHLFTFGLSSPVTLDIRDNRFSGKIPNEIGRLSDLKVLLLSGNNFSGIIPKQLCLLNYVVIMDLSRNSFSGTIPYCLHNMTFGKIDNFYGSYYSLDTDLTFVLFRTTGSYKCLLNCDFEIYQPKEINTHIGIEFVMKYRSYFYKGGILDIIYGLDLSSNKLTGQIPPELGQLSQFLY